MDLAIVVAGTVLALTIIGLIDAVAARPPPPGPAGAPRDPGQHPSTRPSTIGEGLRSTRDRLARGIAGALGGGGEAVFTGMEEALIGADVGVSAARALVEGVRREVGTADESAVRDALRRHMVEVLRLPRPTGNPEERPHVILVTGVNGVGKTTTVGKLAARHRDAGCSVLLVAGDTFRAAASDQLELWATRVGAGIVRHRDGGTPAAVVFDGMAAALARGIDVVLIDTAGRLHTRKALVDELRKVRRVISDAMPHAPHETLLVLDATTGQNAVAQARVFAEAVDVTGVVLTKLDGTARGGVALAIAHELGLPITDIGIGELEGDLRPFDAAQFVDAVLGPQPPIA